MPSYNQRVTTDLSRTGAVKMDGSKLRTDTSDCANNKLGRRSVWVEASPEGGVDHSEMKILLVVAAKRG